MRARWIITAALAAAVTALSVADALSDCEIGCNQECKRIADICLTASRGLQYEEEKANTDCHGPGGEGGDPMSENEFWIYFWENVSCTVDCPIDAQEFGGPGIMLTSDGYISNSWRASYNVYCSGWGC